MHADQLRKLTPISYTVQKDRIVSAEFISAYILPKGYASHVSVCVVCVCVSVCVWCVCVCVCVCVRVLVSYQTPRYTAAGGLHHRYA